MRRVRLKPKRVKLKPKMQWTPPLTIRLGSTGNAVLVDANNWPITSGQLSRVIVYRDKLAPNRKLHGPIEPFKPGKLKLRQAS